MKVGSLVAVLASFVVGLPVGIVLLLGGSDQCAGVGDVPAPSAAAANGIPANYLALYQAAGQQYGLPWTLLAAIGSIESDHGRSTAPGVSSGSNSAGAMGPMQFVAGTWRGYGVDGDHDGDKDVYDPRDAIPGAANYLRASGAPGNLHDAIFAYNHAEWYVQKVLAGMRLFAATAPTSSASARAADTTTAAPAATTAVLNLGDSLAQGTAAPLRAALGDRTLTSLTARSRTSSQGLATLRSVADVPPTVVVQLGTNDTDVSTFRANVLSVLAIARRAQARVLWVNISRPPLGGSRDSQLNAVLAQAAASHDNLTIVDWHAAVATGDVVLDDDVHPSAPGYAARARLIADALGDSATSGPVTPEGSCSDLGGVSLGSGSGEFTLAPTANRPGVPLTAEMTAYVTRMATFYEGLLVVTYGTNHGQFVAGTNRESDHWQGNGVDFGMVANGGTNDGPVGDAIAAAAFMAAGVPHDAAIARGRAGGATTIVSNGLRIQIIWKVDGEVGNHHDHVHVGIGRA